MSKDRNKAQQKINLNTGESVVINGKTYTVSANGLEELEEEETSTATPFCYINGKAFNDETKEVEELHIDIYGYLKEQLGDRRASQFIRNISSLQYSAGDSVGAWYYAKTFDDIREQVGSFERLFNASIVNQKQLKAFSDFTNEILFGKPTLVIR